MDVQDLVKKLNESNISKNWYLINEGIKSDTHILEKYSDLWRYFYFDEKGNMRNECHFRTESEACQYFYDKLYEIYKYFGNR